MDKKKKLRITVLMPTVVVTLLILGLLTFVLIIGAQKAHAKEIAGLPAFETSPAATVAAYCG